MGEHIRELAEMFRLVEVRDQHLGESAPPAFEQFGGVIALEGIHDYITDQVGQASHALSQLARGGNGLSLVG
ncbi:MAG: hypothetical protein U9R53_01170 [Chloroflexota bacterium]|nr:hypothetical protein [Chloroflexota bacterium]